MTDPNQIAASAAIDAGLANRPVSVAQLSTTLKTALGLVFASIAALSVQVANIGTANTDASKLTTGVLAPARLPAPTVSTFGGILSATAPAHQFQTGNAAGVPMFAQPALGDIAGTFGGDLGGTPASPIVNTVLGGLKPWRVAITSLTVTATNTLSALPQIYDGRLCKLFVNGVTYVDKDASIPFTVSGKTIAWSAANSGYALPVGAAVTSECTY